MENEKHSKSEEGAPSKITTSVAYDAPTSGMPQGNKKGAIIAVSVFAIVLISILCAVLIPRNKGEEPTDIYSPETIDFQAGVSLITDYDIRAVVSSRLARTMISINVANALQCSSIRSITLQLPLVSNPTEFVSFS
jgi:hypothetical protein